MRTVLDLEQAMATLKSEIAKLGVECNTTSVSIEYWHHGTGRNRKYISCGAFVPECLNGRGLTFEDALAALLNQIRLKLGRDNEPPAVVLPLVEV